MPLRARARAESWPIAGGFRIARGARKAAQVVVLELHDGSNVGRAECVPYARYGETVQSVRAAIEGAVAQLPDTGWRGWVQRSMQPGAARNAVDCALWDLESKRTRQPVWQRLGLAAEPDGIETMRTVSLDAASTMSAAASDLRAGTTLKVKVGAEDALARIEAVHRVAPESPIVVDANESWTIPLLRSWLPELADLGVCALEQPLHANDDAALADLRGTIPFCADESFHDRRSLDGIEGRYDVVNVKLDKTGGLTEGVSVVREASARGLRIMVGCMVSTSLAIAPALLLARDAHLVDLDGPLLLERDREGAAHDAATSRLGALGRVWGG